MRNFLGVWVVATLKSNIQIESDQLEYMEHLAIKLLV